MERSELKRGMTVTYIPKQAKGSENHPDRQLGIVSSWNDHFVFVGYGHGDTNMPTKLSDLEKGDKTFYCHDEHNSVMDGTFGRCESICHNCSSLRNFLTQK